MNPTPTQPRILSIDRAGRKVLLTGLGWVRLTPELADRYGIDV